MTRALLITPVLLALMLGPTASERSAPGSEGPRTHVVVQLTSPPAAVSRAPHGARIVAGEQRRFLRQLHAAIPSARVRWRYSLVANGVSVVLPPAELPRLGRLPGVRRVYGAVTYRTAEGPDAATIRAQALQSAALGGGAGIKIGIIDDGLDQRHPFFDPSGFTMPPGFPKGQTSYTTAKVIVARAFPPPGATWKHADKPFDPEESGHAMHVAGIAAGNADTLAQGTRISGVAPKAYIGNYKALTIPTDANVGLDGNAPEIVAAIEAAVRDGMDVINLSIGEPEVEPTRDLVALALDAAAAAGVVPVVAAGNDFDEFGQGSLASPGSSAGAITVGATTSGAQPKIASFSSAGPTAISLRLKPDVVAPGSSILSAAPDGWRTSSGTSMASPHVAGAVALLLQRHPEWTTQQVKASLTAAARPLTGSAAATTRIGAGLVDVVAADVPLVRATPTAVSFGLVGAGRTVGLNVAVADAGGGAGMWSVSVESAEAPSGTSVVAPAQIVVPGTAALQVTAGTAEGAVSGALLLRRDAVVRRVPFWGRVATPKLGRAPVRMLARPGEYGGDTRGKRSRVSTYRYPELRQGSSVSTRLDGPEQVFRVRITRAVQNFGVVITSRGRGSLVEPRVVVSGDENRLTGYAALPLHLNPYVDEFTDAVLVAGALRPIPGTYDIVFDSPTRASAGRFTFRFWVDDGTPPKATLVSRSIRRGQPLRIRVDDTGSGVDPRSLEATLDGREATARLRGGVVRIPTSSLPPGRHRVRLLLSDHQETRNNENVTRILPNTRVLSASVMIR